MQFLIETLQLLYYATLKPAALRERMNTWVVLDTPTEFVLLAVKAFESQPQGARRFLAQCGVWWLLGASLLGLLAGDTMPLGWLVLLMFILILVGWGVAVFDLPSGLFAPAFAALVWGLNPGLWQQIAPALLAAFDVWLAWQTGGLLLLVGLLAAGLGTRHVSRIEQWEQVGSPVITILTLAGVVATITAVIATYMAAGVLMSLVAAATIITVTFIVTITILQGITEFSKPPQNAAALAVGVGIVVASTLVGTLAGLVTDAIVSRIALGVVAAGLAALALPVSTAILVAAAIGLGIGLLGGPEASWKNKLTFLVAAVLVGGLSIGLAAGFSVSLAGLGSLTPVIGAVIALAITHLLAGRQRAASKAVAIGLAILFTGQGWIVALAVFTAGLLGSSGLLYRASGEKVSPPPEKEL